MMEDLLQTDMLRTLQMQLQGLLSTVIDQQGSSGQHSARKLNFRIQNFIDVSQETNRVSFKALPSNFILNYPVVASVMAEAPFTSEHSFFEIEVLSLCPEKTSSTVVVGAVQKDFACCQEPGSVSHSIGYRPADGRICEEGVEVQAAMDGTSCVQGDKIGCGMETKNDEFHYVYFTKNGCRVFETPLDPAAKWYPAVSMSAIKEEVRFLEDTPWRSIRERLHQDATDPRERLKMCQETGNLSFRAAQPGDGRKGSVLVAGQPFGQQLNYFEIEIRAMSENDEIAVGAVPEGYPSCLPGLKLHSCGYLARAGGIYAGTKKRSRKGPKCEIGDKIGCGIERRTDGLRVIYFTHNSKSFMEAPLQELIPDRLYPAVGMASKGTGTVCVCILDPSIWSATIDDSSNKHFQVDMTSAVDEELGTVRVDKETARASFTAPYGVAKDAVLVAEKPLPSEKCCFEIEILYGNLITLGFFTAADEVGPAFKVHPGFATNSIGYNAESGQIYVDGKPVQDVDKSTFGDRIFCGARMNAEGQMRIYFEKNRSSLGEVPFSAVDIGDLRPAVAMRSAGQVLALRLLDRELWGCEAAENGSGKGSSRDAFMELVDREIIECPICRDVLTDPRCLPCMNHTFCAECLKSYVAQFKARGIVPCPVCRAVFALPAGGVDDLPKNAVVLRLLDLRRMVPATSEAAAAAAEAVHHQV